MSKPILKDLPDLIAANVITEDTAQRIRTFYQQKEDHAPNRLVIVFGILGALLVGLGIILIIAHNWDTLGKVPKLGIALSPLLIGQAVCAFVLFKKSDSTAWREGAATFLFLAIAASISIVSQVYNIEGTLHGFLFLWMVLALPVIYTFIGGFAAIYTRYNLVCLRVELLSLSEHNSLVVLVTARADASSLLQTI
jgi:uncharacterized membrane protein